MSDNDNTKGVVGEQALNPLTVMRNQEMVAEVYRGPKDANWNVYPTQNYGSTTQNHHIISPNPQSLLNRQVYIRTKMRLRLTGTAPVNPLIAGEFLPRKGTGFWAPRQFPFMSCVTAAQITVNAKQLTWNPSLNIHTLVRAGLQDTDAADLCLTSAKADRHQDYNDPWNTTDAFAELVGQKFNVLGGADSITEGHVMPRGMTNFTVTNVSSTSADVDIDSMEPLFLPPFDANAEADPLTYVDFLDVQLTNGSLFRMLSMNGLSDRMPTGVTISTSSHLTPPSIIAQWISPQPDTIYPPMLIYPSWSLQRTTQNIPTTELLTTGSAYAATTNAFQLNSIPNRVIVEVKRRATDWEKLSGYMGATIPDTNLMIEKLEVQWDNGSKWNTNEIGDGGEGRIDWMLNRLGGNRESLQEQQLFTGNQWILIPQLNWPLPDAIDVGGTVGTHQLTLYLKIRNNNKNVAAYNARYLSNPEYEIVISYMSDEAWTIQENRVVETSGPLLNQQTTAAIISRADGSAPPINTGMRAAGLYGGSIARGLTGGGTWKSIKKGINQAWKSPAGKAFRGVANQVGNKALQGVGQIANKALDAGISRGLTYAGGSVSRGFKKPRFSFRGGALMDQEELEDNMMEYY